ncbi:hypothetical protein [Candidatus Nitrospira inopinata]|jgi:hypothetical protein|uniref:Uncharacterized protein n=1 Tax=Candidatus Nitrospira inopinata TaxID=1715989 RepID=A0A0S4KVC4_9BACT|nr:hypothetical protein [Candidatus Nitrospira inopinata]CUQ68348.1 exported protein of unknown function [Candidatus Nitrospira inopinata]
MIKVVAVAIAVSVFATFLNVHAQEEAVESPVPATSPSQTTQEPATDQDSVVEKGKDKKMKRKKHDGERDDDGGKEKDDDKEKRKGKGKHKHRQDGDHRKRGLDRADEAAGEHGKQGRDKARGHGKHGRD